jgi:hypothetical protein
MFRVKQKVLDITRVVVLFASKCDAHLKERFKNLVLMQDESEHEWRAAFAPTHQGVEMEMWCINEESRFHLPMALDRARAFKFILVGMDADQAGEAQWFKKTLLQQMKSRKIKSTDCRFFSFGMTVAVDGVLALNEEDRHLLLDQLVSVEPLSVLEQGLAPVMAAMADGSAAAVPQLDYQGGGGGAAAAAGNPLMQGQGEHGDLPVAAEVVPVPK